MDRSRTSAEEAEIIVNRTFDQMQVPEGWIPMIALFTRTPELVVFQSGLPVKESVDRILDLMKTISPYAERYIDLTKSGDACFCCGRPSNLQVSGSLRLIHLCRECYER